jgi:hypothetical protein
MALLDAVQAYPTSSDGALPYPTSSDGALLIQHRRMALCLSDLRFVLFNFGLINFD